jgi:hypothetical protein
MSSYPAEAVGLQPDFGVIPECHTMLSPLNGAAILAQLNLISARLDDMDDAS